MTRYSTSFEAELWVAGDLFAFSSTLPDHDEETNFVLDAIKAGCFGIGLSGMLDRYRSRDTYLDILEFTPGTVYLQPLADGEDQFAWCEENDEVTYQLPDGVMPVMFDYYELTMLPEPHVNNYYPNLADGGATFFQASRLDSRVATGSSVGGGGGSGTSSPPDPFAPSNDGPEAA